MIIDDEIVSPKLYADEARLHALLTELRQTSPVRWTQPSGYRPFWAITKHADIMQIERNSDTFLAGPRTSLIPIEEEERRNAAASGIPRMRVLPNMDDPDHGRYRAVTRAWFQPATLKQLEADMARLTSQSMAELRAAGGELDFVREIAARFPARVILLMLGAPEQDMEWMRQAVGQVFSPDDPDKGRPGEDPVGQAMAELFAYFGDLLDERRARPRQDLLTAIATAQIEGEAIGRLEALSYCIALLAANNETTSGAISGGLHALIANPEQYRRLRADPALLRPAIEEMFRFVSPVRTFFRTAARDCEVRGTAIRAGEALLLLYPSANRDEHVFERSQEFDIGRKPNPHVAFGQGPHICLGMQLARMELAHLFGAFVSQVQSAEFSGPTTWYQSNFVGGPKSLPVRCSFDPEGAA